MDTWPILLSPCICLGVADGNLDWKRRKLISFYVGSVGTNRGAEATGEVWQNTRNKVGELKTQKDIFKTHFRPQLTSSFCFMLHPSHRLTTVMKGVQVPRTCPCEQGAKRALSTIGMGCICTYANVCRSKQAWRQRAFCDIHLLSPSLHVLGVLHETRQLSSCHSGPPSVPKASRLLGAVNLCSPLHLQHHAPRKLKFSRPLSEAGWLSCAACTLLRAHHKAGGRIHFSASCSGQQTAPVLWVISVKSNCNNIWPYNRDETKSMPLCTPPVRKGESSAWGLLPSPLLFLL